MRSKSNSKSHRLWLPGALAALSFAAPSVLAQDILTTLHGYREVPSVSTPAHGEFRARIAPGDGAIAYELSYSALQGDVQQAHIHVGQRGVNGGVSVFLCATAASPDPTGLAPTCPASGSVQGMIQAANVVGPVEQGIDAEELAELIAAIRAGVAYVNVHSSVFPGGEIRSQLSLPAHEFHGQRPAHH